MSPFYKLAAIAAFAAMPMSAMAATVTQFFNSTALAPGYGAQGSSYTTPDGFITLSSTGGDVWIGASTVGVEGPTNPAHNATINIGETLRFTFASLVTSVTFTRNLGIMPGILTSFDANGDEVFKIQRNQPSSIPTTTVLNGADNTPILSFLFEGVFGSSAGFSSITYTTADIPAPAPVPLPAAGLLLMGGVGALGFMRRKKSQTPAL